MENKDNSHYAVVFTAEMAADASGYADTAARMNELARQQPGYIGRYHRMEGKREITISYWEDLEAVKAWKAHPEHRAAQELGRSNWYAGYRVQLVRIGRFYEAGMRYLGSE